MAFLFGDSFDHIVTADVVGINKWSGAGAGYTINASGRNGTNALRHTGSVQLQSLYKYFGINTNTFIGGMAFNPTSYNPAGGCLFAVADGATIQCGVWYDNVGNLIAYRGAKTANLGTGGNLAAGAGYRYVEVKLTVHPTAGAIVVRIDGTVVINLSVQNTRVSANTQWDTVYAGLYTNVVENSTFDIDDVYMCDSSGTANNDFIGPLRMKASLVDAAGTYAQFTPSAGANYQNVDEATPNGDTDYNASSTPGQIDTYNFAALGLTGLVRAVQLNLVVRSNASGSEIVAPVVRISGTDYIGASLPGLSTAYADKLAIYQNSPATGVPWTVAEIDGAEFGLKLVG